MSARVLVIEDDSAIADFLVRGLREEGYTVAYAADGDEGRRRLETDLWDVVLLDCWLPKADGLNVLRHFRQQGGDSPVLLLTARDSVADRVRGVDRGADDYLCKPFAFAELLARIRSLSRRQERRGNASLSYEHVTVDVATQRAARNGMRLDLTVKEQSLLVYFLRHAGKVLSRT